jgi:hypothetical protein
MALWVAATSAGLAGAGDGAIANESMTSTTTSLRMSHHGS